MKHLERLGLFAAGLATCAVLTSAVAYAAGPTMLAAAVQYYDSTTTKSVSTANPLPVQMANGGVEGGGMYPEWGADTYIQPTGNVTTCSLAAGNYVIACSNTVFVDQGTTGVTATNQERRVPANFVYPFRVTGTGDTCIAVIGTNGGAACAISIDGY